MKFFIDLEATSPGEEIIAIGVYSEQKNGFKTFVKTKNSTINQYVSQLTGIKKADIDNAPCFEEVINTLGTWCLLEDETKNWEFHCYGDGDSSFITQTVIYSDPKKFSENGLYLLNLLQNHLINDTEDIFKFFHGSLHLIDAYNFVQNEQNKQSHDPLEDAIMLMTVDNYVSKYEPLSENPFKKKKPKIIANDRGLGACAEDFKMPAGKFYCKTTGKNSKTREFDDCDAAIDWIINTYIDKNDREIVRRDRIATKLMIELKRGKIYKDHYWWRENNK